MLSAQAILLLILLLLHGMPAAADDLEYVVLISEAGSQDPRYIYAELVEIVGSTNDVESVEDELFIVTVRDRSTGARIQNEIKNIPNVEDVLENKLIMTNQFFNASEQAAVNPDRIQQDSDPALRLLSFPPGRTLPPREKDLPPYQYHDPPDTSSYVYVIDQGFNIGHEDFDHLRSDVRWIFTRRHQTNQTDPDGHGTCVASKAVGQRFGVSRGSKLILVKVNYDIAGMISAFVRINKDLDKYRRSSPQRAIILISLNTVEVYYTHQLANLANPWKTIRNKIRSIQNDGRAIVVSPAGNYHQEQGPWISTMPAMLTYDLQAKPLFFHRALLAVSALTLKGEVAPFSQILQPVPALQPYLYNFFAPGVDMTCASSQSVDGKLVAQGTSFAAPMVAGLIAYFAGFWQPFPNTDFSWDKDIRKYLRSEATRQYRGSGGPNMAVWNMLYPNDPNVNSTNVS